METAGNTVSEIVPSADSERDPHAFGGGDTRHQCQQATADFCGWVGLLMVVDERMLLNGCAGVGCVLWVFSRVWVACVRGLVLVVL